MIRDLFLAGLLAASTSAALAADRAVPSGFAPLEISEHADDPATAGIAEWFVRPMLRKDASERVTFRWARLDVDGDGYDELALELVQPGLCVADGCPLFVFRKGQEGWTPILTAVGGAVAYRKTAGGKLDLATSRGDGFQRWTWDATAEVLRPAKGP